MNCIKSIERFNPEDYLELVRYVYEYGGRTHYVVYCFACGVTHEWIGPEWGVAPNQPEIGWV